MPLRGPAATPAPTTAPAPVRRGGFRGPSPTATPPPVATEPEDESGPGVGAAIAGAGLLGAGALAARNPRMAATGLGKVAKALNVARMTSMLSGLAVPKSILGNIGATAIASAERKSLAPLKEFFSAQTAKDFKDAFKSGGQVGPVPGAHRLNPFGRFMGAGDVATRGALKRAGMTAGEAEREVLQSPLPGKLGTALESPIASYLIPFRRTPFNQFIEGMETLKLEHPAVLAATTGTGAVHGAATADERYPLSIGLGTAAAARYGAPYALGAYLGRKLKGSKTSGGIPSAILPVSEYGIESSLDEPLKPFQEPAGVRALKRFFGR